MNNIPNDVLEEIILNKVKLFTKESYYRHFRSILLEFYKNILAFKKKAFLSITMTPLMHDGKTTGKIILVRDVTEKKNQAN